MFATMNQRFVVAGIALLFTCVTANADDVKKPVCFDQSSDQSFPCADVDGLKDDQYPTVETDEKGRPLKLSWSHIPINTNLRSDKIAVIEGKEVRRFVVRNKDGDRDGDGLVCLWFGIQDVTKHGYMGFRPFFVMAGDDQIRWWESWLECSKGRSSELHVSFTVKGTGVISADYTIGLEDDGPRVLEKSVNGRGYDEPVITKFK